MIVLALALVAALSGPADSTSLGFADHLFRQEDYFRAITEYKRVAYESPADSLADYCRLRIAQAYRLSGHFESSIKYSETVMNRESANLRLRRQARLNLGLSYLDSKLPQLARDHLETYAATDSTSFGPLSLAQLVLLNRHVDSAIRLIQMAAVREKNPVKSERLRTLASDVIREGHAGRKSPLLAGCLSFILPGSGQWYSRHQFDGLQAFIYTASMAYASYAMYKYEHSDGRHPAWTYVGVSITAMFHAANVFGATRTARYRNWKRDSELYDEVRKVANEYEPRD